MYFLDLKDGHKSEVTLVKEEINGTTPYGVTDLRAFKSRLQNSAGPQPGSYRPLRELRKLQTLHTRAQKEPLIAEADLAYNKVSKNCTCTA